MKLAKGATYIRGENKNQGWGHGDVRFTTDNNPPSFEIGTTYVPYASVSGLWEKMSKTIAEAVLIMERTAEETKYIPEREVVVAIPKDSKGMGVVVAVIQHPASVEMPGPPEDAFTAHLNACLR